jgi:hypothetical protein
MTSYSRLFCCCLDCHGLLGQATRPENIISSLINYKKKKNPDTITIEHYHCQTGSKHTMLPVAEQISLRIHHVIITEINKKSVGNKCKGFSYVVVIPHAWQNRRRQNLRLHCAHHSFSIELM